VSPSRKRRAFVLGCALTALGVIALPATIAARRFRVFERRVKHQEEVDLVCFSADGRFLLSSSRAESRFLIRDLENPLDRRFGAPSSRTWDGRATGLSPDARHVAVVPGEWMGLGEPDDETDRSQEGSQFAFLTLAPDNRSFAFLDSPGGAWVLHVRTFQGGQDVASARLPLEGMGEVTFSPDSRLVAVQGDPSVLLVDARSGELVRVLAKREYAGHGVFAPDSKTLFLGGQHDLTAWSVTTGARLWTYDQAASCPLTVSREGHYLVDLIERTGRIALLDAATGRPWDAHEPFRADDIVSAAFSPAGEVIAIGHSTGDVTIEPTETFLARFR
jgi:WD40 repeat protein